jgi:hypothetical protein
VTAAPFGHIGGAVVGDHGPVGLRLARDLARFYGLEAIDRQKAGERRIALTCARRALALHQAAEAAVRWRRAAGWREPEGADRMG